MIIFIVRSDEVFCMFETDGLFFSQVNEMVIRIAEERRVDTWQVQMYLG